MFGRMALFLAFPLLLPASSGWCASLGRGSLTVDQARSAGDGRSVRLVGKVVTGGTDQMQAQSFFYIQEAGTGIRVRSRTVVRQGDRVTVEGVIRRANDDGTPAEQRGEQEITATSVAVTYGPNTLPAPLILSNREILGSSTAKVGRYVQTSGKVVFVDDTRKLFYVDDESKASDGGDPAKGILVLAPPRVPIAGLLGKTVTIQGIIGTTAAPEAGAPSAASVDLRVLRPCPEKFLDYNMNGFWDKGEPFIDITGNGIYDGIRAAGVPGPTFISRFDDYGTLIVRGAAFMPKGLYCYNVSPGTLDAAVAQGFNVVQHHGPFADSLAELNARGLKTFPFLSDSSHWPAWLAVRNDRAIAGWYLHDEPEWHGISPAQALADFSHVKSQDPDHVIGESHADLNLMGAYAASDEVAWMDRYPVGNAGGKFGIPTIWDFDWTYRGAHGNNPYYPIWQYVQMFKEAPHFTVPTVAQFRAMVFLAMASYVKGYFYFSYQLGDAPWQALWAEVRNINRQMDTLRPFLVLPWTPLEVTSSNQTWVRAGGFRVGNSALLIVVNGDDTDSQAATISLPGIPDDSTLTAPIGGSGQTLTGRAFTCTFAPCEVRVLLYGIIPPDPQPDMGPPASSNRSR